jgi:hypothetical protein
MRGCDWQKIPKFSQRNNLILPKLRQKQLSARGLYGEFDHVPTGIYIPIDTLKYFIS